MTEQKESDLSRLLDIAVRGKEELTNDQIEAIHSRIQELVSGIKGQFVELARWLWIVKAWRLWEKMGFETQEAFIEQITEEASISRTDFFGMIRSYGLVSEGHIKEEDLSQIGLKNANIMARAIEGGGNVEEWKEKAKIMPLRHLELEARKVEGKETPHQKTITFIKPKVLVEFLLLLLVEEGIDESENLNKLLEAIMRLGKIKIFRDLELGYIGLEKEE